MSSNALSLKYLPAGPNGFFRAPVILESDNAVVLIDAGFTFQDGKAAAVEIAKTGKELTTIYISQSDPDYYFSLKPILEQFPNAKVLAAPEIIAAIEASVQKKIDVWGPKLSENGPQSLADITIPTPYTDAYLPVGSAQVEIITTGLANRRYVWSEDLKAVFGGVLVFADVHVWVADSASVEARKVWMAELEAMLALTPEMVIPGHMQVASATDASSLRYTLAYLKTFEIEQAKATSSKELADAMRGHYPDAEMEIALDIGAQVVMGEMKWG